MAHIETQVAKSASKESFKDVWRENGRKRRKTFHETGKAETWKTVIETAGNDTAKAKRAVLQEISVAPRSIASGISSMLIRLRSAELGS